MKKFLLTLGLTTAAGLALSTSALADEAALDLAKKSGCLACHAVDKKVVGPAWQDVANKYKGAAEMTATLTDGAGSARSGAPDRRGAEGRRRVGADRGRGRGF